MLSGCAEAMIALFSMSLARHYCIVDYLNSVACILVLPEDKKCWLVVFFCSCIENTTKSFVLGLFFDCEAMVALPIYAPSNSALQYNTRTRFTTRLTGL